MTEQHLSGKKGIFDVILFERVRNYQNIWNTTL